MICDFIRERKLLASCSSAPRHLRSPTANTLKLKARSSIAGPKDMADEMAMVANENKPPVSDPSGLIWELPGLIAWHLNNNQVNGYAGDYRHFYTDANTKDYWLPINRSSNSNPSSPSPVLNSFPSNPMTLVHSQKYLEISRRLILNC